MCSKWLQRMKLMFHWLLCAMQYKKYVCATMVVCLLTGMAYGQEETVEDLLPEIKEQYSNNPILKAIFNHNHAELKDALSQTSLGTARTEYTRKLPGNGEIKIDYDILTLAIYNSRVTSDEIEKNDVAIIKTLLDGGASTNATSFKKETTLGRSSLVEVSEEGHEYWEVEIQYREWKGTPLAAAVDVAIERNMTDVIELLISSGADVNTTFYYHEDLGNDGIQIQSLYDFAKHYCPHVLPLLTRDSGKQKMENTDTSQPTDTSEVPDEDTFEKEEPVRPAELPCDRSYPRCRRRFERKGWL